MYNFVSKFIKIIKSINVYMKSSYRACTYFFSFSHQSFADMMTKARHDLGAGQTEEIKDALIQEVAMLRWRETMLRDFRVNSV